MTPGAESVEAVVAERGITEVLHFTTRPGLLGVFATRNLKARTLLNQEQYLENIYTPNSRTRKDPDWTDCVSLSISRINTEFFRASGRWHSAEDLWWCVLAFNPVVLSHPDVVFVTTNNIYPAARRAKGASGLEALFAPVVAGIYGRPERRTATMPSAWTTCVQAEALYPRQVSTDHLVRVYVAEDMHAAVAESQFDATDHPEVPVVVDPSVFAEGYSSR